MAILNGYPCRPTSGEDATSARRVAGVPEPLLLGALDGRHEVKLQPYLVVQA